MLKGFATALVVLCPVCTLLEPIDHQIMMPLLENMSKEVKPDLTVIEVC